ncbi:Ankyrin [Plasmopara halstedii]|uniref:Ankyrin n=1 Tax=Plasmopara halstedii TaxID=4781 RepID=A0A0P1AB56_PLAHL|nr:Ankyrin [Plasmopara halstedii]CEG37516.1 Ankyrin [Plasmopara halstedii]|eukprot:XP_024573885.1 Ankyrin [Plasmopara halstedii]
MIKDDDEKLRLDELIYTANASTSEVSNTKDANYLQKMKLYEPKEENDAHSRDQRKIEEKIMFSEEAPQPIKVKQVQENAKSRSKNRFLELSTDFDDGELNNSQIVIKSIYKPQRTNFFTRITGGTFNASTKRKYAPSDISEIIAAEDMENTNLSEKTNGEDEIESIGPSSLKDQKQHLEENSVSSEEEDDISVSIDGSTLISGQAVREHRPLAAEDEIISEVVIHSGDSEPGFATLNPVIGLDHGAFVAPASSGVSIKKTSPILVEIPVAEKKDTDRDQFLLIVHVLGATGLPKVEKFGTQSCYLEMMMFDSSAMHGSTSPSSWTSNLLRTELHKKCGSEAQWNQQFSTPLHSKDAQLLHVRVKTDNKILVGETNISLVNVGELFYDQHYFLFRNDEIKDSKGDLGLVAAGKVHLQLKILNTLSMPTAGIPILQLSNISNQQISRSSIISAKSIPAVLLNGSLFYKIPYHTRSIIGRHIEPRRQWVAVRRAMDPPHIQITWGDPTLSGVTARKNLRSLDLALVTEICEGHKTAAFTAQSESSVAKEEEKCFSLMMQARTLDLVAASKEEARIWISSLRELISASGSSNDASLASARTIEGFKKSAIISKGRDGNVSGKLIAAPTNKRMLAGWRNRIFDLARNDRLDEILECLEDGCPIDLLEGGTGDTLLILACRRGDAELVELCLSRRARNDPHPEFGETALQVAVNSSQAHCVGLLLSTAAKSDMDSEIVNHIDSNNDAPLHVAARHGDLACLQLLLHHGADICVVEELGRTPLHCAVANGNLECVAYFLDVGGDSVLNSGDHDGETALHYAARSGNEAMVTLLLESAANVHAYNVQGESAYDVAVREQQRQCAELISKYSNLSEKVHCASATRNESASTLLKRSPTCAHTETAVQHKGVKYEHEIRSAMHRSFDVASHENFTSQLPLSPSERVRDALRRKSHAGLLTPRRLSQSWSDGAHSSYNEQCVEQSPRNHSQPYKQNVVQSDQHYEPWSYYRENSRLSQYSTQTGVLECAQPSQAYCSLSTPMPGVHKSMISFRQHIPHSQEDSHWDTLYTEDGYPYYVNKFTSVSQWENPFEDNTQGGYVSRETLLNTGVDTFAPDAIIRLRLAEARKRNSQPAPLSLDSSLTAYRETPAVEKSLPAAIHLTEVRGYKGQADEEGRQATIYPVELLSSDRETQVTPVNTEAIITQRQQEMSLSEPSKYEARTGLKISVDVAAPVAQDVSRPVLVPSPRSISPTKKFLEEANDDNVSSSFEKSRASSPRGRSKNIQIIEPKRANNLALALTSFKIHDHYEQIVDDIVTMDERVVNAALLGCLQRFFPTEKEKHALQNFQGSVNTLGKAERFFCLLFQISGMQERIDMFLYKIEFDRVRTTLLTRILVVKRACRDLVENYSLIQALERFFKKQSLISFSIFEDNKSMFQSTFLSEVDEKLNSFRGDLEKAMCVELVDLQLQLNRFVAGIRPIQSFINKSPSGSAPSELRDGKARDILQRFLAEVRTQLIEVELEFESMENWGDKLLAVFGESKATCKISTIMRAIVELL